MLPGGRGGLACCDHRQFPISHHMATTYASGTVLGISVGMRRALIASIAALLATGVPALAQDQTSGSGDQPTATFKAGVDLVTVSATVRDRKGRFVGDLTEKDFEVYDAG